TRSQAGARKLEAAGAVAHFGDITDLDSLRQGAEACDGVIHTAFDHNFAQFAENCQKDARAIEALGAPLQGSARPLVFASSTAMGTPQPNGPAREDSFNNLSPNPRVASERAGNALLERGVNVSVVRLSQIHNTHKQGLVTDVIDLAWHKGVSGFVESGENPWSATHLDDAARLFRLALEKAHCGARYHATDEGAIKFRDIAAAIGTYLGVPTISVPQSESAAHFGWLAAFVGKDMSAISNETRASLGWAPKGPGLLADIANMRIKA
ncbi:SDR family oxidoreductase, partial [Devosia sp.]|uniref:SDR family oxidoreductase n=1 Tax=Devosia sp. TaxID=1871048 RepID=UPI001AC9B124